MDPLSITVSVVTLAEVACRSAALLRRAQGFREAPAEIDSYCQLLEGLAHAFTACKNLQSRRSGDVQLPNDFPSRLATCVEDLRVVQERLQQFSSANNHGLVKDGWNRLKWSASTEHWLRKYFDRLQQHYNYITIILMSTQLEIQMSLLDQMLLPKHKSLDQNSPTPPAERAQLRYECSKPVALYHHGCWGYSAMMWMRSTSRQIALSEFGLHMQDQPGSSAYSCGIHVRFMLTSHRRVHLAYSISQNAKSASLSQQSVLRFSRIVPKNSRITSLARAGDIASMEAMFQARQASPSDQLPCGTTLLHIAAEIGRLELTKYLIIRGADVEDTDNDGNTALHVALARGHSYDLVRTLLGHGSDLGQENIGGKTPMHAYANDVLRRVLRTHDVPLDVYAADNNGMTIVHFVSRSKLASPDDIKRLVGDNTHCLSLKDDLGHLPVHYALMRGNFALSSYLLDLGVASGAGYISDCAVSLLHAAAKSPRTEVMDLALRHCNDIRATDAGGQSTAHAAIMADNIAAIHKAVEAGASDLLRRPDSRGVTPLQWAWHMRAKRCIKLLQSMGIDEPLSPSFTLQRSISKDVTPSKVLRARNVRSWYSVFITLVFLSVFGLLGYQGAQFFIGY